MTVTLEREAVEVLPTAASRTADWMLVVATHQIEDWPPPEWLASVGEANTGA